MKQSAEPKRKAGLEQDIAELDLLIDEILLASRLDAIADLDAMEELDLLALAAEEGARYDDVHIDGGSLMVLGDARLLRRLLRNLVENAFRHGVPPVQISLARQGNFAQITVSDAGLGVPPAEFERIFEPFYRRSGATENIGVGLGLALVKQIARRHGGEAYCMTSGEGSIFVVTLICRR
jgi:signal transduction histidine kinase